MSTTLETFTETGKAELFRVVTFPPLTFAQRELLDWGNIATYGGL
jgi:hypothetical protein